MKTLYFSAPFIREMGGADRVVEYARSYAAKIVKPPEPDFTLEEIELAEQIIKGG